MNLHSILSSLGFISLVSCSGFSGDNASEKFSGNSATKPTTEITDGANQTPDNNGNTNTSTPGCSDGQKLNMSHLGSEIEACLSAGHLYQFNKWSANGGVHKEGILYQNRYEHRLLRRITLD